jgi:hypothetical protein
VDDDFHRRSARFEVNSSLMEVGALLGECFEAIQSFVEGPRRKDLLGQIDVLAASCEVDDATRYLARRISGRLSRVSREAFRGLMPSEPLYSDLVRALENLGVDRFVYHGTVQSRLASILKHGLMPAKRPVWKAQDIREHCASGVFFTEAHQKALFYAEVAQTKTRGPRNGVGRLPVVIRLPQNGLPLEPDRRATIPGCVFVRGCVDVRGAKVWIAESGEAPVWQDLELLVNKPKRVSQSSS